MTIERQLPGVAIKCDAEEGGRSFAALVPCEEECEYRSFAGHFWEAHQREGNAVTRNSALVWSRRERPASVAACLGLCNRGICGASVRSPVP